MPGANESDRPILFGRSSSLFARVARIFAAELRVDYSFRIVRDLMAIDANSYGGNPALKLPVLKTAKDTWFGTLNICRELLRQSSAPLKIVWPEDFDQALLGNAQELVTSAMATEVTLIMSKLSGTGDDNAYQSKVRRNLLNSLAWLEEHADDLLASLPAKRDLSYLETSLFCFVTHLEFRDVVPVTQYSKLENFCERFGARISAKETAFRFDS